MSASSQPIEEKKPVRCLIIQMARLGDSLQSLMALRAAKQLYPNLEIHFLCRESFSDAAKRTPWLKSVFTLSTEDLLGPYLRGEKDQKEALKNIARWLSPVINDPWDMVINWTFSEASSFLTCLIPARIKLGYTRRKDSSFYTPDGWSQYVQGVVQEHTPQNIHLTDILTTQLLTALQIHLGDPMPNGDSPVTSKSFFALTSQKKSARKILDDPTRKWIGIQLQGLPPTKWARLCSLILQRNPDWNLVLLGTEQDREKCAELLASLPLDSAGRTRVLDCVGETDFEQWVYTVGRCQWIFAADSAVIHLASVLGVRVLNISNPQKTYYIENGPYGNGHYVVLPLSLENHTASAEAVYAVWTYACQEWVHRRQISLQTHLSQLGWADQSLTTQAYRSTIRNAQEGGGVSYEPLISRQVDIQDWSAMVLGHIARAWYCGWVPEMGAEIVRESISPSLIQALRTVEDATQVLQKICEQACTTAQQLSKKGSSLRSEKLMNLEDREEIKKLGATLAELESLMDRVAHAQPQLKPFSKIAKVLMHNLKSDQLAELGRETAACYKRIYDGLSILQEWITHTLELVKPVSLPRTTLRSIGNEQ
ncbi:MAG: glycosyltransferase family 9 protein [Bdellovibrio sp.]|nr:glycosyltransferase family 9 protein [Bdellovibrio sp.]